jgi:hypothetical protein
VPVEVHELKTEDEQQKALRQEYDGFRRADRTRHFPLAVHAAGPGAVPLR